MRVTIIQQSGPQLILDAKYDETVGDLVTKLNKFRGPDNQITVLYNKHSKQVPHTMPIRGDLTLYCDHLPTQSLHPQPSQ